MNSKKNGCPVLIVDDDRDLCLILGCAILKRCSVHCEHTLKGAASYLNGQKPSVILLDNNLPDGSGVASIPDLLSLNPDVKIIVMTSDASEGLKERAIEAGASLFISKPFRATAINEILLSFCPWLRAA